MDQDLRAAQRDHQQRAQRRHVHGSPGRRPATARPRPARPAGHRAHAHAATSSEPEAIRYEGPRPSLRSRATPPALETAVLNLLDNAVKYSKEQVAGRGRGRGERRRAGPPAGARPRHRHEPHPPSASSSTRFYRIGSEVRRSRAGHRARALHRARGGEGAPRHGHGGQPGPRPRLDLHHHPARPPRGRPPEAPRWLGS